VAERVDRFKVGLLRGWIDRNEPFKGISVVSMLIVTVVYWLMVALGLPAGLL